MNSLVEWEVLRRELHFRLLGLDITPPLWDPYNLAPFLTCLDVHIRLRLEAS